MRTEQEIVLGGLTHIPRQKEDMPALTKMNAGQKKSQDPAIVISQ
jgi:hypothetical protein